jgi:hypothetical protein
MSPSNFPTPLDACRRISSVGIVLVLCVCVLSQMLGTPVTLFGLLTSADLLTESVSEESSLPSTVTRPITSGLFRSHSELPSSLYLHIFVTSVFHPPPA